MSADANTGGATTGGHVTALSYVEARAAILAAAVPLSVEHVALDHAMGRALASSITSPVALPPWDNAGMDGYAVRRADVANASPSMPVTLRVTGTISAGADPSTLPVVDAGCAVRIMTGAPVPSGADGVIRVEDTDGGLAAVTVRDTRDIAGRGNIRPRGEDVPRGGSLFAAGVTIGPSQLGMLASVGCATVPVFRRPRVAQVSGGDELVLLEHFDEVLAGRRIVSSSSYALPALLRAAGADVVLSPLVPDTLEDTMAAIESAIANGCDLLVTTGGVSVGAHDYTREALVQLGGTVDFWRARIRPGGPIGTGHIRGVSWLGLPGNPVSSMVTATLFAWPMIRRMGGHTNTSHRVLTVTMRDRYETPAPLTYFVRVMLERRTDGGYDAHLAGPQGSNLLHSMAIADALLVVPEACAATTPGATFDAVLLP
ncbi:MAG: molybdopterin molybdotransferase MoeA [Gemmatimonadaceae bacterium]|nr:molybdopterin molybdotransferase MoeA [Gemmatimonadaceae bacterium]